ncbi:hypothetical protein GCM10023194_70230 [Planotetraspora phitsanulokensis]|uniref:Uncharacterized protein n=1 Tax=Planotetraspora phitsanulokensis TaxID=575192 RepID=A0A8J3U207_9ACTN|nr:hypothetical protein [Planotetraspora phitsanulokensis]GII36775.1 hypothetical protein Pph01_17780 [Planotetraspora phitsanulokensis]
MRSTIQFIGVFLAVQGVSGAIDHLLVQPFFGIVLNFFNRVVIPRVDVLAEHALFANLTLALLGVIVVIAAEPHKGS